MRIYFLSQTESALKLGGAYAGILNKSEQFVDIDLNDNIFCEIIPADTKKLPLNFILNQNFLENPPENIDVYNLSSCYKISAVKFYSANLGKMSVVFQKKLGVYDTLVTMFYESGAKLMLENSRGFLYENLPFNFEILNCYALEFMGENLIVIEGQHTKKTLIIVNETTMKTIFKNSYDSYELSDILTLNFSFLDIAKHKAVSKWIIKDGEFIMHSYDVNSDFDNQQAPEKVLPYLLFEEMLCGGNANKYLSENLSSRANDLRKYLGEFIDVIPPPFNIDENFVGLIYRESTNKYYAKYFKVELNDRKAVNILPLNVDNLTK